MKILIILILIGYVFFRVTSFVFSALFGGFNRTQQFGRGQSPFTRSSRTSSDSNVSIDNVPTKGKNNEGYRGGEYVDYEEVK